MIKQPLLKELFFLAILIGVLHRLAIMFSWYWSFWWTDVVMHFLGGLWIGLAVIWFVFVSGRTKSLADIMHERWVAFGLAVGAALAVGLGWEVFELYYGISGAFPNEPIFPDTWHDLVMDALGGVAAYLYIMKKHIVG